VHALEYSKIEYEGCPENSYCKKETGVTRKKWLEQLKNFSKGLINEQKINAYIQNEYGLPISGWAQEEASLLPNILMWDSPCKQHKNSANKYYIDEIFRKNLSPNELKEIPTAIFSHVIVQEAGKPTYSITVPRGDAPLFFKDGSLYYLRDEEGMYYGLLIDREGHLKVIKNETTSVTPKEVTCTKEMITEYLRLAPSPNFYQGQFCKEIWDKTTKSFKTVILGWSCN
jgi:hypothetical protein